MPCSSSDRRPSRASGADDPGPSTTAGAFGPNAYILNPGMPQASIQNTLDSIAAQQVPNQFGSERYAILFEPGTYGSTADPLTFQVGYYTTVAGGDLFLFDYCTNPGYSSGGFIADSQFGVTPGTQYTTLTPASPSPQTTSPATAWPWSTTRRTR